MKISEEHDFDQNGDRFDVTTISLEGDEILGITYSYNIQRRNTININLGHDVAKQLFGKLGDTLKKSMDN